MRGTRTIGLLISARGRTINLPIAIYSELLVAQLRSEAKGEPAAERPLYRLAALAPSGRLAQRLRTDAVTRFVASLD